MANMSYCRFQNTRTDLRDCLYAIEEAGSMDDLIDELKSEGFDDELTALANLVKTCRQIVELADDSELSGLDS